ncbi:hypothetical protein VIGAN_05179400 [Vigna angularis var. angularis]|uniref:PH domain-containing protein n=1 Tax=Vigna angularis var. angularis TaxID=157739 RepID=A0A0S3S671_PHAAN|nr:hypothetical protein VIGAN_05179400 [Vigna angularis var. angularis]
MSCSQVSSVRSSKSDEKWLSIFSGTKTLHLRCVSREDRAMWIEALQVLSMRPQPSPIQEPIVPHIGREPLPCDAVRFYSSGADGDLSVGIPGRWESRELSSFEGTHDGGRGFSSDHAGVRSTSRWRKETTATRQ